MTTVQSTTEIFEQFTTKTVEGLTLWADANQKVMRQFADLSASAAAESVKVYSELQSSAVHAVRGGQEFFLGQQGKLKDLQKDPVATYQKGVLAGVDGAQQAFKLIEANAGTVTKAAERLQESAEKVSRDLQGTFTTLAAELKALYVPADAK